VGIVPGGGRLFVVVGTRLPVVPVVGVRPVGVLPVGALPVVTPPATPSVVSLLEVESGVLVLDVAIPL